MNNPQKNISPTHFIIVGTDRLESRTLELVKAALGTANEQIILASNPTVSHERLDMKGIFDYLKTPKPISSADYSSPSRLSKILKGMGPIGKEYRQQLGYQNQNSNFRTRSRAYKPLMRFPRSCK